MGTNFIRNPMDIGVSSARETIKDAEIAPTKGKHYTEINVPSGEIFTTERERLRIAPQFDTGQAFPVCARTEQSSVYEEPVNELEQNSNEPARYEELLPAHLDHHCCHTCGRSVPLHQNADRPRWLQEIVAEKNKLLENFRKNVNVEIVVDPPAGCYNVGFISDDGAATVIPEDDKRVAIRSRSASEQTTGDHVFQQSVIVLGSCFNVLVGLGFPLSLGALFVDWLETFGSTHAETAVIQSVCAGLALMAGILDGFLIRRFGIRVVMCCGGILSAVGLIASWFATSVEFLIVTIGVVLGTGCSMLFLGSNVNVTLGFAKGRVKSLALALLIMSGGLGMMIFPPILQALKEIFGWRGSLLIMAGVFLNTCVSTILVTSPVCVHPSKGVLGKARAGEHRTIKWSRLLDPLYFAYVICAFVGFGTITATALTTIDFSLSKGLSQDQGSTFLLLVNSCTTVSRLIAGLVLLVPGVKTGHIYCMSYLVGGAALLVLSYSTSHALIITCFGVYGFGSGGMVATYGAGILRSVGEDLFPVTMGLGGVVSGLSFALFGIIIGTLYDLLGSYDLAFRIFGAMSVGASGFFFIVGVLNYCRRHKLS